MLPLGEPLAEASSRCAARRPAMRLTDSVDEILPILVERGLSRAEYESVTLRGSLGLSASPAEGRDGRISGGAR